MSNEFKVGDTVRWDDVMGHSEQGIIVETQFHHYVIGRTVDGELVPHGYVRFDEPTLRKAEEPAQVATKVDELGENLKHLDKPGCEALTPHGLYGGGVVFANDVAQASFYFRKGAPGRNKAGGSFGRYDMRVERELDSRPSRFFDGETVRVPQQSQAIRDGYCHWFPVALENTTYSDAITRANVSGNGAIKRGYLVYSIANTRHYSNTTMRDKQVWYLGNKAL